MKCGHGRCADPRYDNRDPDEINNSIEYYCECDINWENDTEGSCVIPKDDVCEDTDCGNGHCIFDFENNVNVCICDTGFTGDNCNVTYCLDSFCSPGTCVSDGDGYYCICDGQIHAQTCRVANPCDNVTCGNGYCVKNGTQNFYCFCQLGFEGEYCDTPIVS